MAISGGNPNRQRMINLMYIVFIAMMALNVSSEVVDGFTKVERGLEQSISSSQEKNKELLGEMATAYESNPQKTEEWFRRSQLIQHRADSLFSYMQYLKQLIAEKTDGAGADPSQIERKDYVGASEEVMLAPLNSYGKKLRGELDNFRQLVRELLGDTPETTELVRPLETKAEGILSWEEAQFNNMPTIAAVAMLTKLQHDVRLVQGQTLAELIKNIDKTDYRVNDLEARVLPESKIVMRGSPYRARIVLGSVDTTQRPTVVVNGQALPEEAQGIYSVQTHTAGVFPIRGYLETKNSQGENIRREFASEYTVVEPMATIAPVMMNVLYAGIDNPINIAVPGIPMQDISATMSGGSLVRSGNRWIARPTKVGQEATISVSARMSDGRQVTMGQTKLRVRALPDPMPYIQYTDEAGNPKRFKGGRLSKQTLLSSGGIRASIDDSFVDVAYTVVRFQLITFDSMGNALPEVSSSGTFSERQLQQIRNLPRGKRLYVTEVIARGPDGVERKIPSIEIILN